MEAPGQPLPDASSPAPDDDALAVLAAEGDTRALDTLLRRHHSELARLLWRFARSAADHDDLVQEVFVRVMRGIAGWRPQQPFLHWLRKVTVNTARDHCRREGVRRRHESAPGPEPARDGATATEAVDPAPDPAARAAADDVKAVLARLPADDRTLLTLHYLEGWDFATIGAHLGWSGPLARLRAFRARARLRAELSRAHLFTSA